MAEETMDPAPEATPAAAKEFAGAEKEAAAVTDSSSTKEENNKVEELPNPEKKALDELKQMVREALNAHEFAPKLSPAPVKEEEKKPQEGSKPDEKKEEEPQAGEEKAEKPAEGINKPASTEGEGEISPPLEPEGVSIWGIPLLADERSDVILLKFLRARDFKAKDAFSMLKSVIAWRNQFKSDELLEDEELGEGLDKVVFVQGADREGHPVCYNSFAEFQDKELYQSTFADKEKLNRFLKWRIQFMEKSIRNLDFSPDGINTFLQVIDLKNSPGLFFFKKELRHATNQALQLLQDNYPEFVAKQVFINVPWWYPAYYKMINVLFTTRTKSKFVFTSPSKSVETLFKYIAPEQLPVQYGGLSREGDYEFTTHDPAIEDAIKPTSKHVIQLPVAEKSTLVWEVRVIGWDVSYGAEFVPAAEGAYTIVVEKPRKIGPVDETIMSNTYNTECAGKVVLTFDNETSKRKKLLYRSKTKQV